MSERAAASLLATPAFGRLLRQCIHCGLCLQACPTYAVFGTEMDGPRGRIALLRAAAEGRVGLDGPVREHLSRCLACRACETACPSGVQYGALVETARIALERARRPGAFERLARRVTLRGLLPHAGRLRLLARLARLYQRSGLQNAVRSSSILPERLRAVEALLPSLPARYPDYRRPALAEGQRQGAVAFFHGCVQESFLGGVNEATIRVLQRNGYEVHFPAGQTCCGAAPLHVGDEEQARRLARRNVDAFLANDYDAIVNNAGGCGAMLKEYDHLLRDDPDYAHKAKRFVAKVADVSEFLAAHLNNRPTGILRVRATYVDSCHLRHAQKVVRQPRDLLRAIPGLELVELRQPDRCCGSAGTYNILHTDIANAVLDAKMADIAASGADTVVTTNAGCYLQLVYGVRRARLKAEVVHLVELLDRSYAAQH